MWRYDECVWVVRYKCEQYQPNLWKCIRVIHGSARNVAETRGVLRRASAHMHRAHILRQMERRHGVGARAKKERNGTKTKLQEYSLGCCAITYSNPTEFIVQYFMTTNDFRFVKRDDPWQHLQESKSKWEKNNEGAKAWVRLEWQEGGYSS